MIRKAIWPAILSGILFTLLLSSCGKDPQFSQILTAELLEGTWKVGGSPDEYQIVHFSGDQEFKIDSDGDGTVDILGYYDLDGKEIIFGDDGGRIIPECHRKGRYIPKLRGNRLSFELVSDECPGRLKTMKRTWQRNA